MTDGHGNVAATQPALVPAMASARFVYSALLGQLLLAAMAEPASARTCGFSWAIPGTYEFSGNFRGWVESASARLTGDCRVVLHIPGVFAGDTVSRAGSCLKFAFKIQGQRRAHTARWCNRYGIVPWNGRNIRARVVRR